MNKRRKKNQRAKRAQTKWVRMKHSWNDEYAVCVKPRDNNEFKRKKNTKNYVYMNLNNIYTWIGALLPDLRFAEKHIFLF